MANCKSKSGQGGGVSESSSWYRVAHLKPRLRNHVDLRAHSYRGRRWYVLQDPATGECQRISPAAYALVGRMNGDATLDEIFRSTQATLGDEAPTQDEAIRVLGSLHRADVLQTDMPPDVSELFVRSLRTAPAGLRRLLHPFMIRIPMLDPDRWLTRWKFLVRPLFSPTSAVIVILCLLAVAFFGTLNASILASDAASLLGDPRSWMALVAAYVGLKILHELGHAFAARTFGAEVHEMGITLLFFMPIPYVDTSRAGSFSEKQRRIAVSLAGIAVESMAAGLALFVWWLVEPGFVRAFCAQLFFLGTTSTLLFNGNPLLRYDAYYALADALEIPNLYERSRAHLRGFAERHLLGLDDVRKAVQAEGESGWLAMYGVASGLYRGFLVFAIAWMLANFLPGIGTAVGLFWVAVQIGLPVVALARFLLRSPRLVGRRSRILMSTGGAALCLCAAAILVPVSNRSLADGVVWLPEHAQVRAGTDGFVARWLTPPGSRVEKGQAILRLDEPLSNARVRALQARLEILRRTRHGAVLDRMRLVQIDEEIATVSEELRVARERLDKVVLVSPSDGVLLSATGGDLPGRFVRQGDVLGYVVEQRQPIVRVALDQEQMSLVRSHTKGVDVRLGSPRAPVRAAQIVREVPAARHRLPSAVLGAQGGGPWPVDPADPKGLRTKEPVFWIDVKLDHIAAPRVGDRVYVRFEHEKRSLVSQLGLAMHGLFLRRLDL
jgi:putative peptide zinc metalloprotease protein